MVSFATPNGLRYAAHCFNRSRAQQSRSALIPAGEKLGSVDKLIGLEASGGDMYEAEVAC